MSVTSSRAIASDSFFHFLWIFEIFFFVSSRDEIGLVGFMMASGKQAAVEDA